jgi:DNA-binding MarR family transcriptional regulator
VSTAATTPERKGRRRAQPRSGAGATKVDIGALDGFIGFHLRMAQETALRAFIASSHRPDFKPGHFAALMVVRLNPDLSQIEVCRAIGRDKSTISPLIRELERDGLIVRGHSAIDRRTVTLRLSPKGEAALDGLFQHAQAHDRRLDAIVGKTKPELIALLKKITAALS